MGCLRALGMIAMLLGLITSPSVWASGEFEWMAEFNARAEADLPGFKARLAVRFGIGEPLIERVFSQVPKPAEAYMIFRLGEMSGKPPEVVLERYQLEKGRGWGELAKSLGIKPGSREFHALKRGSDLYQDPDQERGRRKTKEKGKGRS